MKQLTDDVYLKIEQLGKDVKEKLRQKGIIVPLKSKDGSINVGHYSIKKKKDGFYCILDFEKEILIDMINLPQTAAVLANQLALGKLTDSDLLTADKNYGYALFDEELHVKLAEKNIQSKSFDRADVMSTKSRIARYKKEEYKRTVVRGFDKLIRIG